MWGLKMRICGIELKGSSAIVAIIDDAPTTIKIIPCKSSKILLHDPYSSEEIRSLQNLFVVLFQDHEIENICIKKRAEKGDFKGSSISFKIETIIQTIDFCTITFISPNTIAALKKRHSIDIPTSLHKYQQEAFLTAYTYSKVKQGE